MCRDPKGTGFDVCAYERERGSTCGFARALLLVDLVGMAWLTECGCDVSARLHVVPTDHPTLDFSIPLRSAKQGVVCCALMKVRARGPLPWLAVVALTLRACTAVRPALHPGVQFAVVPFCSTVRGQANH
jgi:hypothetical protein